MTHTISAFVRTALPPLSTLPDWSADQRKTFHRVLADWTSAASDADLERLNATITTLKEELVPGQICSIISLYRLSSQRAVLLAYWPPQLLKQLQAANLPRVQSGAPGS